MNQREREWVSDLVDRRVGEYKWHWLTSPDTMQELERRIAAEVKRQLEERIVAIEARQDALYKTQRRTEWAMDEMKRQLEEARPGPVCAAPPPLPRQTFWQVWVWNANPAASTPGRWTCRTVSHATQHEADELAECHLRHGAITRVVRVEVGP